MKRKLSLVVLLAVTVGALVSACTPSDQSSAPATTNAAPPAAGGSTN